MTRFAWQWLLEPTNFDPEEHFTFEIIPKNQTPPVFTEM